MHTKVQVIRRHEHTQDYAACIWSYTTTHATLPLESTLLLNRHGQFIHESVPILHLFSSSYMERSVVMFEPCLAPSLHLTFHRHFPCASSRGCSLKNFEGGSQKAKFYKRGHVASGSPPPVLPPMLSRSIVFMQQVHKQIIHKLVCAW